MFQAARRALLKLGPAVTQPPVAVQRHTPGVEPHLHHGRASGRSSGAGASGLDPDPSALVHACRDTVGRDTGGAAGGGLTAMPWVAVRAARAAPVARAGARAR